MKVNFWHPIGQARQFQKPSYVSTSGHFVPLSAYTTSTGANVTAANSAALVQLAKSIQSTNSHFMGGVFLGEIREVVRMIARPARTLREGLKGYLSTLQRRKSRAPKHRLNKILADTWLEYSFGWQPLVNDTMAAAEALARWNLENEGILYRRSSCRGFGVSQAPTSVSYSTNLVNNYCYYRQVVKEGADCIVRYKVGMDYKATAPVGSAARLAELSGFNLNDFIPTVWELVPWSFLVDYFTNVGDIISFCCTDKSNMTWICKSQVQTGWREIHAATDTRSVVAAIPNKDLISIEGDSLGTSTSKRSVVTRTSPSNLDYPKLEFSYPPFESSKWINLAALWQGVRRLTPYR
nr:MAG: hypothetical protein 1 [Leviviridae sp.]